MRVARLKALGAIAVLLASLLTSALFAPAPAGAATQDCPLNSACLWEDHDFQTSNDQVSNCGKCLYALRGNYVAHLGSQIYAYTHDFVGDSSSSGFISSTTSHYRFYKDANCVGAYFDEGPLWGDTNFGNGSPMFSDGSSVSDRISSVWRKESGTAGLDACRNA
jgi:hypothetical protein